MGIKGFWQLIQPNNNIQVARPVRLEALAGERIAVDASIWLYHFLKAMRDSNTGEMLPNAHIVGFVRRVCKLLFYNMRPVFVFDGKVPELKRKTARNRRDRKEGNLRQAQITKEEVLKAKLKKYAIAQLHSSASPSTSNAKSTNQKKDEFELPFTSGGSGQGRHEPETHISWDKIGLGEIGSWNDIDLESINVKSTEFKSLPKEIQQEILREMRLRSRQTSWDRLNEMIETSESAIDFSKMQIKNLVKRNSIWQQWDASLKVQDENGTVETHRIASEYNREYILVKNRDNITWTLQPKTEEELKTDLVVQKDTTPLLKKRVLEDDFESNDLEVKASNNIALEGLKVFDLSVQNRKKANIIEDDEVDIAPEHIKKKAITIKDDEDDDEKTPFENNLKSYEGNHVTPVEHVDLNFIETFEQELETDIQPLKSPNVGLEEQIHFQTVISKPNEIQLPIETCQNQEEAKVIEENYDFELERIDEFENPEEEHDGFAEFVANIQKRDTQDIQNELDDEIEALRLRHHTQKRDASTLSSDMIQDIKTLLTLFGVPFIDAPSEAEAQCADLKISGFVDGIITDDSDVFVFGGDVVYKNMFNQTKERMISLAYVLGSDYCEGIEGVGPAIGMEILSEFEVKINERPLETLRSFSQWVTSAAKGEKETEISHFKAKYAKMTEKWLQDSSFPDSRVYEAYVNPDVDHITDDFKWDYPDLVGIKKFLQDKLAWDSKKVDLLLLPVIKNITRGTVHQQTLDKFISTNNNRSIILKPSLMASVEKLKKVDSLKECPEKKHDTPMKQQTISSYSSSSSSSEEEETHTKKVINAVRKKRPQIKQGPSRGRKRTRGMRNIKDLYEDASRRYGL